MSAAALGGAPTPGVAGGRPGAAAPSGMRGGAFALPASTSFRFALLIAAVLASSIVVYEAVYVATPRGAVLAAVLHECLSRAQSQPAQGAIAHARVEGRAYACRSGAERAEGLWVLLGIGVLAVLAAAIYAAQPWWYRRRMRLAPLTGESVSPLVGRLEELRQRAGAGPVVWLLQPLNIRLSAFAFGHLRRRFVAVSGGAVVAAVRQPADFDAVILHELAHIRNRDINQTYLAVAIWRAFVVAVLLPMVWLFIFRHDLGPPQRLLWRVAVLALTVYLLRNSVVRSREFDADARVAELDPDTSLGTILAGMPPRAGRRVWHLGWLHPSGQERAAALLNPAPRYRCGFWDGLAIGLVAAIGASAAQQIAYLLITAEPNGSLVPAAVFALFSGPALAIAMWRNQLQPPAPGTLGWAAGLGLGIGVAVGPFVDLSASLDRGVAPDSLRPAAIGALATWVVLMTFVFMSIPVWVGSWADAWQRRGAASPARVPARGGMLAASAGTWVVLTVGLDLVLAAFTFVTVGGSARIIANLLAQLLMSLDYAPPGRAWAVCVVLFAVPLSAVLINRQRQRPSGVHDAVPLLRRLRPTAVICLAGGVAAFLLALVIAAVAHAGVAEPVRWNTVFASQLFYFDEQALVGVAVVSGLIAAARPRSVWSFTAGLGVTTVVAAIGAVAFSLAQAMDSCIGPLSAQYDQPPASSCQILPYGNAFFTHIAGSVAEAIVAGILLIPGAHAAWRHLAQPRLRSQRGTAMTGMLRWIGAGAVVAVVVAAAAGTGLWAARASAHNVRALGSIGRDGWVHGPGYRLRLRPSWYAITGAGPPGLLRLEYWTDTVGIEIQIQRSTNVPATAATFPRKGARPVVLDGTPGRGVTGQGPDGIREVDWFVVHGSSGYVIRLAASPAYSAVSSRELAATLDSWHWIQAR